LAQVSLNSGLWFERYLNLKFADFKQKQKGFLKKISADRKLAGPSGQRGPAQQQAGAGGI
jgi:hypothetical protein